MCSVLFSVLDYILFLFLFLFVLVLDSVLFLLCMCMSILAADHNFFYLTPLILALLFLGFCL